MYKRSTSCAEASCAVQVMNIFRSPQFNVETETLPYLGGPRGASCVLMCPMCPSCVPHVPPRSCSSSLAVRVGLTFTVQRKTLDEAL